MVDMLRDKEKGKFEFNAIIKKQALSVFISLLLGWIRLGST